MGPLFPQHLISEPTNLLFALFIGIGFGFVLEAAGFTNTRKLAGVFYGYDFTVLKVFFTAALTAAIGLFLMDHFGMIDISLTFYPVTYWIPTLIGGIIMGLGFIVGGFCPGTSLCAASTGKIDAIVFIGGVFIGIFGYAFTYGTIFEGLRNSGKMGKINTADWLGIPNGLFIFLVTLVAVIAFVAVTKIQKKVNANKSEEYLKDLGL
ncbi:MAG: YeeE/YedE family protein [Bacteroidales bacterium]|nr:YeeE/YedE family protein [Bacteroidales bacterium]